jgi:predicted  nucleic acid-binding Zn-ribbon protein
MACLDHVCVACGYGWMDNQRAWECPKCGGRVSNDFDEDLHDHEDDREEDDDEPEDAA